MWHNGHPQHLSSIKILQKIKSEQNNADRLSLESEDLSDLFQMHLLQKMDSLRMEQHGSHPLLDNDIQLFSFQSKIA